jgi:protein-S-isoprenylcysteine O-methyltransferase Ste14
MKKTWLISCGNFFFHYRNSLFPFLILLAVITLNPTLPWGSAIANNITDLIGAAIALTGQFLRVFTIGYKYIKRGGKNKQVYADTLVVDGVFAHCRNPMYVGNLLIFLGVTIAINSPLLYAIGIPFMGFVYASIIAAEENFLRGKFGTAFEDYCVRVPRLIPNLHGMSDSLRGYSFQWRRVLLKEYGTISATLVGLIGIRMWTLYECMGAESLPEVQSWLWTIPFIALFYATIFILKKSRHLTESIA